MKTAFSVIRDEDIQTASQVGVIALAVVAALVADRSTYWVDEQIARRLIERWTLPEILTVLPLHQPHYPTWYVIPEVAGWPATYTLGVLSMGVTAAATMSAARALEYRELDVHVAGVLVAVSPFLAVQASWLRMYGVLTAAVALAVAAGLRGAYARSTAWAALASVLHPFGSFAAAWSALVAASARRYRVALASAASGTLPVMGFLAVNLTVGYGGSAVSTATTGMGHGTTPSVLQFVLTPMAALTGSPHSILQALPAIVVSAVLVTDASPDRRVLAAIALPLVGITVASAAIHPVFRLKYFGMVAPTVALVIAGMPRGRPRTLAVGGTLWLLVFSWLNRMVPVIVTRRFTFWF